MGPFNNEVIAAGFLPLHSSQLMWYQVTLCPDGWWSPSSICKVHPCFLSQTFYLEILFGKLPETLPVCSKNIFPIYPICPLCTKRASKVPSNLAREPQPQTEASFRLLAKNWQEFYLGCFHTGLFYTVITNIWSFYITTGSKFPKLYPLMASLCRNSLLFLSSQTSHALPFSDTAPTWTVGRTAIKGELPARNGSIHSMNQHIPLEWITVFSIPSRLCKEF